MNMGTPIYFDKVHKKEFLPTRIRYSQFFFYSLAFYLFVAKSNQVTKFRIFR